MASRTSPPGTDSSPVVDIEDFVVESSVGWRNGSGQASPPVQYRQRDVGGISGGEGVDGPGAAGDAPHLKSRCRSSGETSKTKVAIFTCPERLRG